MDIYFLLEKSSDNLVIYMFFKFKNCWVFP